MKDFVDTFTYKMFVLVIQIINHLGDLTDVSALTAALVPATTTITVAYIVLMYYFMSFRKLFISCIQTYVIRIRVLHCVSLILKGITVGTKPQIIHNSSTFPKVNACTIISKPKTMKHEHARFPPLLKCKTCFVIKDRGNPEN